MNSLVKTMLLSFLVVVLGSCAFMTQPIASSTPENNKTYQVDYLFEHEGCKVYRFTDMGSYVYFTNCSGEITNIKNDSTQTRVTNKVRKLPAK